MAAIVPTDLFAGYALDTSSPGNEFICIPISNLTGLTLSEANATTGDGREVARILIEKITASIEALDAAAKPTKMTITRNNVVGVSSTTIRRSYNFAFDENVDATVTTLASEPI